MNIYLCIFNILLYWNENWRGICINLGYIDLDNGTISIKHNVYDKPKDE